MRITARILFPSGEGKTASKRIITSKRDLNVALVNLCAKDSFGFCPKKGQKPDAYAIEREITSEKELFSALMDLCHYNLSYFSLDPDLPDVYDAGIVYEPEPPGQEDWLTYPVLLALGFGDCEDLACARVSYLWHHGETKAKPYLYHKGRLWHVMVQRGDGSLEDPSAVLGMYDYSRSEVGL